MAGGARKAADDALVAALAGGSTVQAAAQLGGVSEATVYRRLKDPAFRRRIATARAEVLERALGHLAQGSAEAAIVLRSLLAESKDERIRLAAARAVLELGPRLREDVEVAEEIAELRRQLEDLQRAGSGADTAEGPAGGAGPEGAGDGSAAAAG